MFSADNILSGKKETLTVLFQCWSGVIGAWPALKQHSDNVSCLLGPSILTVVLIFIFLNNVFKLFLFNYDIIRYIHPASNLANSIPCSAIYDLDILLFFPVY